MAGTGNHPGPYSPSRFSFGLCLTDHVGKRCYPRPLRYVRPSGLPYSPRSLRPGLSAYEHRSSAYRIRRQVAPAAAASGNVPVRQPVFRQTHSEALSGLYSLSSFPPCFQGRRSVVVASMLYVAAQQVPSRAALHRPEGFRPRRRDLHPLRTEAAPKADALGTFQRRPRSRQHHRIERRDYSAGVLLLRYRGSVQRTGLLRRASVEPDKPLSWHPALPAQHLTGG